MKITAALSALALVFSATLSAACPGHSKQAMSCADGMVYDSETHSCTTVSG